MSKAETTTTTDETDDETADDDPEIEDDLVKEELRIDGICGVY